MKRLRLYLPYCYLSSTSGNVVSTYFQNIVLVTSLLILLSCGSTKTTRHQTRTIEWLKDSTYAKRKATDLVIRASVSQMNYRYDDAINEFSQSLRYDTNATVLYCIARCYQNLVLLNQSFTYSEAAISLDSSFAPAWDLLGELYISRSNFPASLECYKRLVQLENTYQSRFKYAKVLSRIDYKTAIVELQQLLRESEDPAILFELYNLYQQHDMHQGMISLMSVLSDVIPEKSYIDETLLELYLTTKQYGEALNILQRNSSVLSIEQQFNYQIRIGTALLDGSLDSTNKYIPEFVKQIDVRYKSYPEIYELSGLLSDKINNTQDANSFFNTALRFSSNTPNLNLRIASYYEERGDLRMCDSVYKLSTLSYSTSPAIWFSYAIFLSRQDSIRKAITATQQSIRLDSNQTDFWGHLGFLYDKAGFQDSSDLSYEHSIELDSDNPFSCNNLAYSLVTREVNLNRALQLSGRAIRIDSTNASFLDTYGWVLFKLGRFSESVTYLEKASTISQTSATLFEHLGDNYEKLGLHEKAVDAWRRAYELDNSKVYLLQRLLPEK